MTTIGGGARRVWLVGALTFGMLATGAVGVATADTVTTTLVASPRDTGEGARFRVAAGPLVLTHNGSRYEGTMRVSVRNVGTQGASGALLSLGVPPGLLFLGVTDGGGCVGLDPVQCVLFTPLEPGARTTYTMSFGAFAAPARHARRSAAATVTVTPSGQSGPAVGGSATYSGLLRGTTGSIRRPRPYLPATTPDAAVRAGTPVVEPDGTGAYAVRIPVTVRSKTDAYNSGASVQISAPPGSSFPSLDPPSVCTSSCIVPGGWMGSGETRSFAVVFTFRPANGPGRYPVTIRAAMLGGNQPDANPDDNVVTVDLIVA
jgi:hypothetical protein